MSSENSNPDPTKKKSASEPKNNPKFSAARMRPDCLVLFGITTSTYDGATYGLSEEYTVEEMKTHIEKWQNEGGNPAKKRRSTK